MEQTAGLAEALPLENATFDYVVTTLVLCSLRDVDRAIGEVVRVLKPGGRYLFLEHGLSPDPGVRKWQRRLNPLQKLLGGGCRLDLDVAGCLGQHAFGQVEVQTFSMEKLPKTHGFMYRGAAVR